jgi:hypothetical protein
MDLSPKAFLEQLGFALAKTKIAFPHTLGQANTAFRRHSFEASVENIGDFCSALFILRQPEPHLRQPQLCGRRAASLGHTASMLPNARGEHWVSNDGCQEENWHTI